MPTAWPSNSSTSLCCGPIASQCAHHRNVGLQQQSGFITQTARFTLAMAASRSHQNLMRGMATIWEP
jgi:hypothetical protein